jgi:acyl-homoserine-lactone acylase
MSFGMVATQKTKRIDGERGNSVVAVAGGESADPASKHVNDQAEMDSKGQFKDVLFYEADIEKFLERKYHPGQ